MTTAATRFATPGFGPENLPYGSFSTVGGERRLGVRLGDLVVDLGMLARSTGVPPLADAARTAVTAPDLDPLLAAGHTVWQPLRTWLQEVVTAEGLDGAVKSAATPLSEVSLHMPFAVADYVDYYASEQHASNIGRMFRPDQAPLLPNWKHLPVGYHGRAGTVIPSGTDIPRPKGLRPEQSGGPSFGPSRRLDIEAELGFVLGGSAPDGEVSVARAGAEHLFGVVLFNDWSARDIQGFEYVPLGPYLGKSFASSISLWVVPFDALTPALVEPPAREHELAAYLDDSVDGPWGLDITMAVDLDGETISHPPARTLYWTAPQMVAHMSVNGASIRPGDFFGSGTVSGDEPDQRGSLMELSWGGKEPLQIDGREQAFLEDGQTVTLRGTAPGADGSVIDFGECVGTILPAT